MPNQYYFISDLHLGGEGLLDKCDFEDELISFLKKIENEKNTELVIVGDTFDFWKFTKTKGIERLKNIISKHKKLFHYFSMVGNNVKITLIPGNHDRVISKKEYKELLKKYKLNVEEKNISTRKINNKKIWIEHGDEHENFTFFSEEVDSDIPPIIYNITKKLVKIASEKRKYSKKSWLRDIQSIDPRDLFKWTFSNYFYKEMNPVLRYAFTPFLILFMISLFIGFSNLLNDLGFVKIGILNSELIKEFWLIGDVLNIIIYFNITIIIAILFLYIPYYLVKRDVNKTMKRLKFDADTRLQKEHKFVDAAKNAFNKKYDIFIFAHTHDSNLKKINNKIMINTGTWIKKLKKIKSRFTLLPPVYYPSYRINYFRVFSESNKVVVEYNLIPKKIKPNLTFLERMAIMNKKKKDYINIPKRTIIN